MYMFKNNSHARNLLLSLNIKYILENSKVGALCKKSIKMKY